MEIDLIPNIENFLPLFEIINSEIVLLSSGIENSGNDLQIRKEEPCVSDDQLKTNITGFGDPSTNQQVEEAAISWVTNEYTEQGWSVKSVETEKCGYDLLCTKEDIEEHVEVKGIQGSSISFIITAGEVRQSQVDYSFVLYAVTSALTNPVPYKFTAKELRNLFSFEIVSYRAYLKHE